MTVVDLGGKLYLVLGAKNNICPELHDYRSAVNGKLIINIAWREKIA